MEPSPLVYDTAASAAVWQRVSPSIPAFDAAPCPTGASCPLPRRESEAEAALGALIGRAAEVYALCRRCGVRAPRSARRTLEQLALEQQRAVRALLAAYFLHTGRWRQPPAPPPGAQEPWLVSLRRVYAAESGLCRGCGALERTAEDGCLRQLLAVQRQGAEARAKRLALLLENTLTTGNNLLKW